MSQRDWKKVSEAAAREQDPNKLMELIEELNRLLEERENQLRGPVVPATRKSNSAPSCRIELA
jgi:hypothetical protein